MKFLHLSDLHIHTRDKDNVKVKSILNFILKKYPDHRLILTGDITDDGAPAQYENAYALLKPFKDKIFICPGNHDFGAVGNFYGHERALRFDNILATQLDQGGTFKGDSTPVVNTIKDGDTDILLIALDSNLETEHPFDFACGEIGETQLKALKTILSTTQGAATVKMLFLHHHPFEVNNPFMELKDAEALASAVYGRIDLIFFGHKHEMNQWENIWGTKYILASDNSPGKDFAKEITIDKTGVLPPKSVPITEALTSGRSLKTDKNKGKKSSPSS
jgi:3',5'-cyclic AMP phosphodiesterase CpdA